MQAASWFSALLKEPPTRWMSILIRSIVEARLSLRGPTIEFCTKLGSFVCACRVEASRL